MKQSLTVLLLLALCLIIGSVSAAPKSSLKKQFNQARPHQRQHLDYQDDDNQNLDSAAARESAAFTEAGIDADEKNDPINDESAPADPEFNDGNESSNAAVQERSDANDEDSLNDLPARAASSLRWSDRALLDTQDTNIANAKIRLSAGDMATAAGHHHHKKHYVSGWLKMGAESGKKGAFKWHDKHPVGGKGRR